jgi:hypothetical protein
MATSTTTLSYRYHGARRELELSRFTHYHGCTEQTLKECRTMDMPSTSEYFAPRPATHQDPHTIAAFERLYAEAVEPGTGEAINYTLDVPRWAFLCYLCDHKEILLHGSGNPDITEFEPRQSNDIFEFGNRRAVYAASDGIWPIYFAIADRDGSVTSLMNACFRVLEDDGTWSTPYYLFSINGDALDQNPWRNGTIYILPRATFRQQPNGEARGRQVQIAQWASPEAVKPLAKLAVGPEDFPFLSRVYAHDPKVIRQRAAADPEGFPWPDET